MIVMRLRSEDSPHILDPITEDTTIFADSWDSWDSVIVPPGPGLPAIEVWNASLCLINCTVEGGKYCIQAWSDKDSLNEYTLDVIGCQLFHAKTSGVHFMPQYSGNFEETLVERCGRSPQKHHGIYAAGSLRVTGCIVRDNSGYQIHSTAENNGCIVKRSFLSGDRKALSVRNKKLFVFKRNTYHGSVMAGGSPFDANASNIDQVAEPRATWACPVGTRVAWIAGEGDNGRGCYDYDPSLTKELAETLYDAGQMANRGVKPSWGPGAKPHFPETPTPELPGVGR